MESKLIPWAGSSLDGIREATQKASVGDEQGAGGPRCLKKGKAAFEALRTSFALWPRPSEERDEDDLEDVYRLVAVWRELCAKGGGVGNIASQFLQ